MTGTKAFWLYRRAMGAVALAARFVAGGILVALVVLLAYSGVRGGLVAVGPAVARVLPGLGQAMARLGNALPQGLWITEVAEFALVPIGFLGAALALRARAHQGLDAVTRLFPRWLERGTEVFVWAVVGGFGGVLAWLGALYVASNYGVGGGLASAPVPKWPFYLSYPAAGALFVLFAVEGLLDAILGEARPPEGASAAAAPEQPE